MGKSYGNGVTMLKYDWKVFCRGKYLCTLCRTKEGNGRKFRTEVIQHLTEQVGVDFECPKGFAWDAKIESEVKPMLKKPSGSPVTLVQIKKNVELSKQRFEICKTCEHATENGHKCALHKGCCFGSWRSRPTSQCPDSPPKWLAETTPQSR